ncbi:MAG: TRAP transporter large permease [Deltaproteobacteria bacterium]|nr:TRAP transporter large permease [Deltaproteobacteria bacterium]
MSALAIVLSFFAAASFGLPLFLAIALMTLGFFTLAGGEGVLAAGIPVMTGMWKIKEAAILVSLPFFTLAGSIMTAGGTSRRLVNIARALVGWLPGGLALAMILASTVFAALSGSSAVTIIAIGGILFTGLSRQGYKESFSLGLITSCGAIGILVPPSLPLIIYGVMAGVQPGIRADIRDLFIGGIVPGIVCVLALMLYAVIYGKRAKIPREKFAFAEVKKSLREGAFAIALPVILLVGIYGGIATVSEVAAVAVMYALIVEIFVHKEIKVRDLPRIMVDAGTLVASILVILFLAMAFTNYIVDEQIPDLATEHLKSIVHTRTGMILAINLLLLVVGSIMDIFSALVIFAPLIVPIACAAPYNLDPIHLGIIFVVNLEIGFAHPPFGINLYVAASYFKKSVMQVTMAAIPFIIVMLGALMLISFVPELTLWLVGVMK